MQKAFPKLSGDVVQTIPLYGRACHILAFTHPSARGNSNWGRNDHTPYLLNVVEPSVKSVLHGIDGQGKSVFD